MTAPTLLRPAQWLDELLVAMGSVRSGRKHQCPGHALDGEHAQSLALREAEGGKVLLYCHAGCETRTVLARLRLSFGALAVAPLVPPARWRADALGGATFPPPRDARGDGSAGWVAVAIDEHPYGDPATWAWKVRERNAAGVKRMRWESLNPKGERVPGLLGRAEADMPLYRIRDVRMAVAADELVVLVESESSVDALAKAGIYATTWAGGASSAPLARLADELAAARVLLVPDYDDAGLACAERIVGAIPNARVQLGDQPGDDARDVLTRHGAGWFQ